MRKNLRNYAVYIGMYLSGDFSGIDIKKNQELVVKFWQEDGTLYKTKKTFKENIPEQLLIGEDSQDISE